MAFFAFPAKVPRLALALGLEFSADELRAPPHNLRIEASGPGQEPPVKPLSASFTVTRDVLHPDQPVYFHVVYNLEDITLPAEGEYVFSVFVDEQLAKQVPLRAQQAAGPLPAELESQILLNEGYQAFASGDLAAAERLFRDVATRFPAEAGGHNNLGFLLLSRGRADAALAAFVTARELEYVHPELLDVNMGCAHYLVGDFVSASIFFEQCLSSRGFRGPQAMLFAIQESRLFPVPLNSAAEYVSLVMLNGAWSALRTGDRAMALRYLEGAQAGSLGRREDESGRNFAKSVEAARLELATPPMTS
jgi:tetratricopeptide (TPR) repeat protein